MQITRLSGVELEDVYARAYQRVLSATMDEAAAKQVTEAAHALLRSYMVTSFSRTDESRLRRALTDCDAVAEYVLDGTGYILALTVTKEPGATWDTIEAVLTTFTPILPPTP